MLPCNIFICTCKVDRALLLLMKMVVSFKYLYPVYYKYCVKFDVCFSNFGIILGYAAMHFDVR